jgi:hypothetical protein
LQQIGLFATPQTSFLGCRPPVAWVFINRSPIMISETGMICVAIWRNLWTILNGWGRSQIRDADLLPGFCSAKLHTWIHG